MLFECADDEVSFCGPTASPQEDFADEFKSFLSARTDACERILSHTSRGGTRTFRSQFSTRNVNIGTLKIQEKDPTLWQKVNVIVKRFMLHWNERGPVAQTPVRESPSIPQKPKSGKLSQMWSKLSPASIESLHVRFKSPSLKSWRANRIDEVCISTDESSDPSRVSSHQIQSLPIQTAYTIRKPTTPASVQSELSGSTAQESEIPIEKRLMMNFL